MAVLSHALPLYESIRDTDEPGPPRGTLFFRKSAPSYIASRSTATSTSFRLSRSVKLRFRTAFSAILSRFSRSAFRNSRTFENRSSYDDIATYSSRIPPATLKAQGYGNASAVFAGADGRRRTGCPFVDAAPQGPNCARHERSRLPDSPLRGVSSCVSAARPPS